MRFINNIIKSEYSYYLFALIIIVGSLAILKYKNQINHLKEYEAFYLNFENWYTSNTILRSKIVGREYSDIFNNEVEKLLTHQNSIILLFDYGYCFPCFTKELSRLNNLPDSSPIGLMTTPKNSRELNTLAKNKLGKVEILGTFNTKIFWTEEMEEIMIYIKISNGIICDALIIHEFFSDLIDNWIKH